MISISSFILNYDNADPNKRGSILYSATGCQNSIKILATGIGTSPVVNLYCSSSTSFSQDNPGTVNEAKTEIIAHFTATRTGGFFGTFRGVLVPQPGIESDDSGENLVFTESGDSEGDEGVDRNRTVILKLILMPTTAASPGLTGITVTVANSPDDRTSCNGRVPETPVNSTL